MQDEAQQLLRPADAALDADVAQLSTAYAKQRRGMRSAQAAPLTAWDQTTPHRSGDGGSVYNAAGPLFKRGQHAEACRVLEAVCRLTHKPPDRYRSRLSLLLKTYDHLGNREAALDVAARLVATATADDLGADGALAKPLAVAVELHARHAVALAAAAPASVVLLAAPPRAPPADAAVSTALLKTELAAFQQLASPSQPAASAGVARLQRLVRPGTTLAADATQSGGGAKQRQ